jgi:hypothetical protein
MRHSRRAIGFAVSLALVAMVQPVGAQRDEPTPFAAAVGGTSSAPAAASRAPAPFRALRAAPPAFAPVLSLIVPGTGQFAQGQQRFIAYLALEGLGWWKYAKDVRERRDQVNEYKDLARRVARAHFSPNGPDGDWTYYESMRDYLESGDYSESDSGPIVPQSDPSTFNGYTWQVAEATTTNRADALAQYEARAVKPDMQWSWRNAGLQYDLFKRTTAKRNDAASAAATDLTLLALNHLLSMVDAFATFRLESRVTTEGARSVGVRINW